MNKKESYMNKTAIASYMIDSLGYSPSDISDNTGAWDSNLWDMLTPDQQKECIDYNN